MKKLFLIPLLALFTCVNMWADVTTWTGLKEAMNAGGTITLGDNIDAGNDSYVHSSSAAATVKLNGYTLSNCTITNASTATITIQNGTLTNCSVGGKVQLETLTQTGQFLKGNITIVRANNVATNVTIKGGNSSNKVEANIIVDGTTTTNDKVTFYNANFNGSVTINSGASAYIEMKAGANTGNITNNGNSVIEFKNNAFTSANKTITMNAGGSLILYGSTNNSTTSDIAVGTNSTALINIKSAKFGSNATFAPGNNATLQLTSGKFYPSNAINSSNRPAHFNLTGGTTNFDPSDYLGEGYTATEDNGLWTITSGPAVRNNTTNEEYTTFTAAYAAINAGDELELLTNCNVTANTTFTTAFSTVGDKSLIVNDGVTATFNNADINIAKLSIGAANVTLTAGTYGLTGTSGNVIVNGATVNAANLSIDNGTSFSLNSGAVSVTNNVALSGALTISGGSLTALAVNLNANTASFAMSAGTLYGNITTSSVYNTLNITGGTINGAINLTHYGTNLAIGGVTVVSENGPALRSMATNNLTISSGSYTNNGEGEVVEGGNGSYKLTLQGGTYNKQPNAAYIPAGYEVVGSGPYTVQAAQYFVSVSKNGGAAQSFSNMNDFIAYLPISNDGSNYTITLLCDYEMNLGNGLEIYSNNTCTLDLNGHQLTASSNDNKSKLLVGGTLILNANGGSIVIPNDNGISVLNGGKATINGGTYTTDEYNSTAFYADAEGKLIINGATIDATVGCAIRSKGNAIVKNTTITSACNAMYAVINAGNMSLISTNVTGNHGAVACIEEAGTLDIDGGVFRAVNQELSDAYAALYVATSSMVSAKNAKFYSDRENYAVLTGDNDSGKTFGIVNLYDGCYLSHKMFVSAKKVQDSEITFPVQLAESSAWYASFNNYGPLPAGYEYNASDIEGYAWKVVSLATETKEADDDPAATIPWQQNTTWDATADPSAEGYVPESTTVVTIPADKEVVVKNIENNNVAEAEQIFLGNGASLTVETGAVLNVGNGGVNIANGGSLTVQPGAIVTVGAAGLITTEEDALVIEGTEEDQGVFLIAPAVTENTQPKATVKLVTKAKQVAANEFIWERFAIPTLDGNATVYSNEGLDTVHYYGGGSSLQEGLYEWSGSNWAPVSSWKNLQPFKGYQLTNNSMYGNVVYTFEGNLVGNADQDYAFAQNGFGFFGNSYSGDIDIKKFMESFGENMQKTIWIYDYYTDGFKAITESSYGTVYYGKRNARHGLITDIRSMQAFLMNTFAEGESATTVDYSAAIWGNPKYGLVSNTPAPAPKRVAANEDKLTIYVAGAKQEDEVSFIRSNAYSSAFDNGADASKWMNNGLNLYVVTEDGEMAAVAADEIADMTIAFQSGNETEYTLGFDNISGEEFALRDVLTGAVITIAEGTTYTFTQAANTTVPARFQIIGTHKMPTGIENAIEGANVQQKVMLNGNLYILRDNKWYSAQGQLVK